MNVFRLCVVPLVMFTLVSAGIFPGNDHVVGQENEFQRAKELRKAILAETDRHSLAEAVHKNAIGIGKYYEVFGRHQQQGLPAPSVLRANSFMQSIENEDEDEVDQSLISDYWIGVQCEKAGSTTYSPKEVPDAELKIDGGMKVLAVTEGGGADESGLEEGDVMLKFAAREMNSVNDLYAVIGETEDNEADLLIIREGELVSLQITPQKRPEPEVTEEDPAAGLWKVKDAIQHELDGRQLPKGYRLQIELAHGEDVIVAVSKGKQSWSADAESIEKLPEKVRTLALDLISKCQPAVTENVNFFWRLSAPRFLPQHQFYHPPMVISNSDNRLIDIYDRLSELTQTVKQLKEELED